MAREQSVELELDEAVDCGACASRLEGMLRAHEGVEAVRAGGDGRGLIVRYDPDLCSPACMGEVAVHRRSHTQLRVLRHLGLVRGCRDGRRVTYVLFDDHVARPRGGRRTRRTPAPSRRNARPVRR